MCVAVMVMSTAAFAEPSSFKVKSGIFLNDGDETVEVGSGLFLNDEATAQIQTTIVQLEGQNNQLREMVLKSVGAVPFLPQWASVVISASLAVLTAVATFFAVKEAANTIK